ncbi:hypothetical protein ACIQM0_36015 [Streptomyces sp. NPDC091387]|uniref:hypothetical protein n=1 Tax=Streptomyces sp. NPDC091387 TaxID=3365998 RepID=UPI00382EBBB0
MVATTAAPCRSGGEPRHARNEARDRDRDRDRERHRDDGHYGHATHRFAVQQFAVHRLAVFQALGSALGASVFGTVLSRVYAARGPGGSAGGIGELTGAARQQALHASASSTNVVFYCATGVMILAVFLATRLPGAVRTQEV